MEEIHLTAKIREKTGKGIAHQLRQKGLVPAVIYGKRFPAKSLSLNPRELFHTIRHKVGMNHLMRLKIVDGEKSEITTVLVKELQIHPIHREYTHVDLIQVNPDDQVKVEVPILLIGKAAGVKEGGILQQALRALEVFCQAAAIPKEITVDVSALDIGDAVHLGEVTLPAGVKTPLPNDTTVAVCVPPEKEEVVVAAPVEVTAEGVPAEGAAAAPGEQKPAGEGAGEAAPAPAAKPGKKEKGS
jgi:large subunit ribosomal protein L25